MKSSKKARASLAACICILVCAAAAHAQPLQRADRVVIAYVEPVNPAHRELYNLLKSQHALERARDVLSRVRWPQPLKLELKSCETEANAWYENNAITVCYEYLEDFWTAAASAERPQAISREDAFVGPLIDTFMHEAAHAVFEQFKVPLLGREEDAADQVAAYLTLQLPKERRRGLILGSAYTYTRDLSVRSARDLNRPRLRVTRHVAFAGEHGAPAQRLYSLLCVAYGSDKDLFADLVEKGFLPKQRAEHCEDDYRSLEFAYHSLIAPHTDGQGSPNSQRP